MTTRSLTHRYVPRGTAKQLFFCREPEVLVAGPAGTGKSMACLEKLHMMLLLNPGMRALAVRKTMVSLTSTGLVTYRQKVAKEAIASKDVRWYGGSQQESAQYQYSNGSALVVGGMDNPDKVMSSEYDVIYVQEATELSEGDWEALTSRLRNGVVSFQQLIADCNPSTPTHWLLQRCNRGTTVMLASKHEENPSLFNEDGSITDVGQAYLAKLDNLTGVRYLRLRKGQWCAAEGLIYEDFDPSQHLVTVDEIRKRRNWNPNTRVCSRGIPWDWSRYWVVDFGFTNPFVLQRWAQDHDGRLYLYAEQYMTQRLVEDHAADALTAVTRPLRGIDRRDESVQDAIRAGRREWTEPKPVLVICDHDAEGRATLERYLGMSTVPAKKMVTEGIQGVQKRLKAAADGLARIFFIRDAVVRRDQTLADAKKPTSTIEELPGYVWDTGTGKAVKEVPLKLDDHGCDTTRYLVAELDFGGRPRFRYM